MSYKTKTTNWEEGITETKRRLVEMGFGAKDITIRVPTSPLGHAAYSLIMKMTTKENSDGIMKLGEQLYGEDGLGQTSLIKLIQAWDQPHLVRNGTLRLAGQGENFVLHTLFNAAESLRVAFGSNIEQENLFTFSLFEDEALMEDLKSKGFQDFAGVPPVALELTYVLKRGARRKQLEDLFERMSETYPQADIFCPLLMVHFVFGDGWVHPSERDGHEEVFVGDMKGKTPEEIADIMVSMKAG